MGLGWVICGGRHCRRNVTGCRKIPTAEVGIEPGPQDLKPLSKSENILPAPAGNRTQVAGSTGKHSTTSL